MLCLYKMESYFKVNFFGCLQLAYIRDQMVPLEQLRSIFQLIVDEFSVSFSASKSMCMLVSKNGFSRSSILASVNEVPFLSGWQCAAFC